MKDSPMRELSLFVVELLTDRYCSRAIDYVISEPTYAAFLENLQDRVPGHATASTTRPSFPFSPNCRSAFSVRSGSAGR